MNRGVIVLGSIVVAVVLVLALAIGFIIGSQEGAHGLDTARTNPYVRDDAGVPVPSRPDAGGATTGSGTVGSATGTQGGGR